MIAARAAVAAIALAMPFAIALPLLLAATPPNILGVDLASLPNSGPAFDRVRALANQTASLDLGDLTCPNIEVLLANAIMGEKADVLDMVRAGEATLTAEDNSLSAGRCLAPVAVALSLVDAHEEDAWLQAARDTVYANFGSIVYPGGAAAKANNHGSASDMSVIAIDAHLGDVAHLEQRAIPVWRARLGDAGQTIDGAPVAFNFGSSIQVDPANPVVVGRVGTTYDGVDLDGLLLEEQRRSGGMPNCGNYNFGASGQFLVTARILTAMGYPVESWGDNAVQRIFRALARNGCIPVGDDVWQGSMVTAMFGSGLMPLGVGDGKSFCCTDYLFPTRPMAGINATPASGAAPLAVTFRDTSLGSPTSWAWNFGDGESSSEQHPTHAFAQAGVYTVNLTVTNDLGSDTETATVTAIESPPNAVPTCADLSLAVVQDRPGSEVAPWCTDANSGDVLTYDIGTPATRGVASVTSAGKLLYVPTPGESGIDSFTYTASDATSTSAPATVSVMITANAIPECAPLDLAVVQDHGGGNVAPSCTDANVGDELTYEIGGPATKGVASVSPDGTLRYVPLRGESGTDSFTYLASDASSTSAPATVTITIAENAVPTCDDLSLTLIQDHGGGDVAASCTDGDGDPLSLTIFDQGALGTASIASGRLRYVPNAGESGTDSFVYTASDATSTSAPAVVNVTITLNGTPACSPRSITVAQDAALGADVAPSCTDAETDDLTYAIATNGSKGVATVTAGNRLQYVPNAGQFGSDSFTYTARDASTTSAPATVTVTITPTNVAPVCSARSLTVAQGSTTGADVAPSCSDANGDVLTYAIATNGSKGVASVAAGQLHYVPNPGQSGSDSFTYTAFDGTVASAAATVSVTITPTAGTPVTLTPVADTFVSSAAPTANNGAATTLTSRGNGTQVNSYLRFTVSGLGSASSAVLRLWVSDASPDAGKLHRIAVNTWGENLRYANRPTPGLLITDLGAVSAGAWREIDVSAYVTGDGTYSFGIIGENSNQALFHSREGANDPQLVVTPGVGGGNVAPVCSARSLTVAQGSTTGADVAPSCSDANGDVLTYAIATNGSKGVASVAAGQLHYVPNPGQSGSDSFTYTAFDGTVASAAATVSVTITPTAGTPVTLTPVADTFVSSAAPTANNGAATTLTSRGNGTQVNSYLRFTVSGLGSASSAVLRLWVSDASPDAGKLHRIAVNTWGENLRYANRPTPGLLITDLGAVSAGAWREIDVSAYVTGDGTYSFGIIGENSNQALFHSREGANDPQLVVTP